VLETSGTRPLLHRATCGDGATRVLYGHFAVWDEWTRIESAHEGAFLERIAKGAFERTILERRDLIKCLFQHGSDPHVGDKPLGRIEALEEDAKGAAYIVPLLTTSCSSSAPAPSGPTTAPPPASGALSATPH
jgi:phage head maturation protease